MSKALAQLGQTLALYPKCKVDADCMGYFDAQNIKSGCCASLSLDKGISHDETELIDVDGKNKLAWIVDYVQEEAEVAFSREGWPYFDGDPPALICLDQKEIDEVT